MIQANEMRIGNWFTYGNQSVNDKVFKIDFDRTEGHLINGSIPEDYLQPIPLTPEILEKAGFVKEIRGKKEDFDGVEFVYHRNGIDIYDHTGSGSIGFSYATYTRYPGRGFKAGFSIQSLHQLQNLYFALTGQELEIKL